MDVGIPRGPGTNSPTGDTQERLYFHPAQGNCHHHHPKLGAHPLPMVSGLLGLPFLKETGPEG